MRITLGVLMIMAAIGHFSFQRADFQAQVPDWIPFSKDFVVLASGMAELTLGLGMVLWVTQKEKVGLALAIFFVLIFPGNIAQYVNGIDAFGLDSDSARLVRLFFQPVLVLWALWSSGALQALKKQSAADTVGRKQFYDLEATNIRGEQESMKKYRGKIVLAVNTATQCGLAPQLKELEALYQKYKAKGVVILGFPSNQFANQEPGDNQSVAEACQINYGVSFPMFGKIIVNGSQAHPIFVYLKQHLGGFITSDIKWNFTKFLIDQDGNPIKRYAPTTKPQAIAKDIERLLSK